MNVEHIFGEYKYYASKQNNYEDTLFYQDKQVAKIVLSCYPEYTKKYRNILSHVHSLNDAEVNLNKIRKLKRQIREDIIDIQSVVIDRIDTSYWVEEFNYILLFLDKIIEYVNANHRRKNVSVKNREKLYTH